MKHYLLFAVLLLSANAVGQNLGALTKAAQSGDSAAQYELGKLYLDGEKVDRDAREAVQWLDKAASAGNAEAQTLLGVCYYYGDGLRENSEKAVELFEKSLAQGNEDAKYMLAVCCYYGEGIAKNPSRSYALFEELAAKDNADALYMLGKCCLNGFGVEADASKAVACFNKAAEAGNILSLSELGDCYFWGNGLPQDRDKALKLYADASDQACGEASYKLAVCCLQGFIPGGNSKAAFWLRQSGEQGYTPAFVCLGLMNFDAETCSYGYFDDSYEGAFVNSWDDARGWYNVADGLGDEDARKLLSFGEDLDFVRLYPRTRENFSKVIFVANSDEPVYYRGEGKSYYIIDYPNDGLGGKGVPIPKFGARLENLSAESGQGVVFAKVTIDSEYFPHINHPAVYSAPSYNSKVLGRLGNDGDSGSLLDMLGMSDCLGLVGGWFKISYRGREGYVPVKDAFWDPIEPDLQTLGLAG